MEPRKRKRLLLATIVALVAGFWLFFLRSTEPTYEGKRLSEWIEIYGGTGPLSERQQADVAIQALGTNALPCLLQWIAYETAPWRFRLGAFAERLPAWLTGGSPLIRLTDQSAGENRARYAETAFQALGPLAVPAIPELARLLAITNSPSSNHRALFALSCIGSDAVPAIANLLSSPRYAGDMWTMHCIQNMGTNARTITPIVISNLTHTNGLIAKTTAHSFVMVGRTNHLDAELLVPALIRCLQDPRPNVRERAFLPLKTFGAAAAIALPTLTNALNDPNPKIRAAARDAIETITGVAPP